MYMYILFSGKLSREKTLQMQLFAKVFSTNFGACYPLVQQKRPIRESFLRKYHIFHQFAKVFSLKSFPLYGSYIPLYHISLKIVALGVKLTI